MTMVERVARALCQPTAGDWDKQSPQGMEWWFELSRAAIAAMSEPSDGMIAAGQCAAFRRAKEWRHVEPHDVWTDMLTAALAEADLPTDATGVE